MQTATHTWIVVTTCLGGTLLYVGTLIAYIFFVQRFEPIKPIEEWRVGTLLSVYKIPVNLTIGEFGYPSNQTLETILNYWDPAKNPLMFRVPVPVISTMFAEWPLVSSGVVGLGATLMFVGVCCVAVYRLGMDTRSFLRDWLIGLSVLSIVSIWMSIASAVDTSREVAEEGSWVHVIATGLFVLISLAVLLVLHLILLDFYKEDPGGNMNARLLSAPDGQGVLSQKEIQGIRLPVLWIKYLTVLASLSGICIVIAAVIQKSNRRALWVYYFLIISEFVTLEVCGIASAVVVYCYMGIDSRLRKTANKS